MGVGLRLSAIAAAGAGARRGACRIQATSWPQPASTSSRSTAFPTARSMARGSRKRSICPTGGSGSGSITAIASPTSLRELLPDETGLEGSISTVPGTFGPIGRELGALDDIAENLLRHAAYLAGLSERTGKVIALALEPEPMCHLETTEGAAEFVENATLFRKRRRQLCCAQRLLAFASAEEGSAPPSRRLHRCVSCRGRVRDARRRLCPACALGHPGLEAAALGGSSRSRGRLGDTSGIAAFQRWRLSPSGGRAARRRRPHAFPRSPTRPSPCSIRQSVMSGGFIVTSPCSKTSFRSWPRRRACSVRFSNCINSLPSPTSGGRDLYF